MCSVTQLCLTLCHSCAPGSFVHGIFQVRMLEWVAISYFHRLGGQHVLEVSASGAGLTNCK